MKCGETLGFAFSTLCVRVPEMTDSGAAYAFFAAAEFSVVVTVACLVQLYAAKEVKPEERLMIGFAWGMSSNRDTMTA